MLLLERDAKLPTAEQKRKVSPDVLALIESNAHIVRKRARAVRKYLESRDVSSDLVRLIQQYMRDE